MFSPITMREKLHFSPQPSHKGYEFASRSRLNRHGASAVMAFLSDGTELIQSDLLCGMLDLSRSITKTRTEATHPKARCSYFL